jgi:hypothetical protein
MPKLPDYIVDLSKIEASLAINGYKRKEKT